MGLIAGVAVVSMALAGGAVYLLTRPGGGTDQKVAAGGSGGTPAGGQRQEGEPDGTAVGGDPGGSPGAADPARSGQSSDPGKAGPARGGDGTVAVAAANPIDVTRPTQLLGPSQDRAVNILFSPDGRRLAVFTQKGEVHLWDLTTRESTALAEAGGRDQNDPGTRLAFTADGKTLLAGNAFAVTAWDTATGQTRHQFGQVPEGVRTAGGATQGIVAVSPDGAALVTLDYPGTGTSRYQVWDTGTLKERFAFDWPDKGSASLVRFSPDGKTLAATAHDGKLTRLWDVPAGRELDPIREGYANIALVDGPPRLLGWQAARGNVYHEWEVGGGPARLKDRRDVVPETGPPSGSATALTADGRTLVSSGILWDVAGRKQRAVITGCQDPFVPTPDGKAVLALANLRASPTKLVVAEVDAATGQLRTQHEFGVPREEVFPPEPVAVSADGAVLAVGAKDGVVHLRPLAGGGSAELKQVAAMTANPLMARGEKLRVNFMRKLKFSPDGRFLIAQVELDPNQHAASQLLEWNILWDIAAGKHRASLGVPGVAFWLNRKDFRQGASPTEVAKRQSRFHSWTLLPGGNSVWVTIDNIRWLPDVIPGRPQYTGEVVDGCARLVEFDLTEIDRPPMLPIDPDGRLALQLPADFKVPEGKIAAGPLKLQPFRDPWEPLVLEASPNGATVAGVVRTRTTAKEKPPYRLALLDPKTLKEQASLAEFAFIGKPQVAFSSDGKLLAATFAKRGSVAVRVWDVGTRTERPTTATTDGLLAFADGGRALVTSQGSATALIYDSNTGQKTAEVDLNRGHPSVMTAAAVSPAAPVLATGGHDGELLLRDLRSGDVLVRLVGHPSPISGVAFTADGTRLAAAAAADLTAKVWEVPGDLKPPAGAGATVAQVVRLTPRQPAATGGEPPPGPTGEKPVDPVAPVPPPVDARLHPGTSPKIETNSLGMKFALLPAGTFDMGAPDGDPNAEANERPVHNVRITKPFAIGVHEVTVGQFRAFVQATGYKTEAEKDGTGGMGYDADTRQWGGPHPRFTWKNIGVPQTDKHPVVNVSWNDAKAFCMWLRAREILV